MYCIGLDLGGTTIQASVVNCLDGSVLKTVQEATQANEGAEVVYKNIESVLSSLLDSSYQVNAIGIGTPGMVNTEEGKVVGCPNILGWSDVPFIFLLKDRFSIPVFAENDANLSALGEHTFGLAQKELGFENSLSITLGTGVGGGIIIGNHIFKGSGYAGEIGHMNLHRRGRLCSCGSQGCLEQYVSRKGIEQTYREANEEKSLVTAKDIFDKYRSNDPVAIDVVRHYCDDLACGIGDLLNIFDIPLIFLSGGVARSSDVIIPLVESYLSRYVISFEKREVFVRHSSLKDQSGVLGAAQYAYQGMLAS